MRCLQLVGSLKLQVSFAKEPYKKDDILQKRPMILRSLLIEATPYMTRMTWDTHLSDANRVRESLSDANRVRESLSDANRVREIDHFVCGIIR